MKLCSTSKLLDEAVTTELEIDLFTRYLSSHTSSMRLPRFDWSFYS